MVAAEAGQRLATILKRGNQYGWLCWDIGGGSGKASETVQGGWLETPLEVTHADWLNEVMTYRKYERSQTSMKEMAAPSCERVSCPAELVSEPMRCSMEHLSSWKLLWIEVFSISTTCCLGIIWDVFPTPTCASGMLHRICRINYTLPIGPAFHRVLC